MSIETVFAFVFFLSFWGVFFLWRVALSGYRRLLFKYRMLLQSYQALQARVYQQQIKEIDD